MVFDKLEYDKAYYLKNKQTYKGIRYTRIHNWKSNGIITPIPIKDYYDTVYIPATYCEKCHIEFAKESKKSTSKNLDHDHQITDRPNVRNIVCSACNGASNRREMQKNNTSGYSNIRKRGNTYRVKITIRKEIINKSFKTLNDAIKFRDELKQPL